MDIIVKQNIEPVISEMGIEFQFIPENIKLLEDLFYYITNNEKECHSRGISTKKGFLLNGPVGCGKTTIIKIIARFCIKIRKPFSIIECRHAIREFQEIGVPAINKYGLKSFRLKYSPVGYLLDYEKPIIYCFDDFGLEETNSQLYGNKISVMNEIMLDRYSHLIDYKMKTFAITNLGFPKLREIYGERMFDRFKEMFNDFTLNSKSFRK